MRRSCLDCQTSIGPKATRCKSCVNRLRWRGDDPRREKLLVRNAAVRNGATPYAEREWLRVRYEDRLMTLRQIASEAGCSLRTIARWMSLHEIPTRDNLTALSIMDRAGPKSPRWRGGPPACPSCGRPRTHHSKTEMCASCYDERKGGEGNPNWRGRANVMVLVRGWVADHWRPLILARDNYTCRSCGVTGQGDELHTHHIRSLSKIVRAKRSEWKPVLDTAEARMAFVRRLIADPDVRSTENGITLCVACHRAAHARVAIAS